MRAQLTMMGVGSRALSYFLGFLVIAMAGAVMVTSLEVADILDWANRILGVVFITVLGGLIYVAILALVKVSGGRATDPGHRTWFEAGVQAANAVATLALTYTLLGISLGIGGLSDQALTPDTVQDVIRGLTERFSMAFMTTVLGLPLSALLRALLLVSYSRSQERHPVTAPQARGDNS